MATRHYSLNREAKGKHVLDDDSYKAEALTTEHQQVAVAKLQWGRLLQPWQRASPLFSEVAPGSTSAHEVARTKAAASAPAAASIDEVISIFARMPALRVVIP